MTQPSRPIRLVALDLDGTTLNPHHELNPTTIETMRKVSAQGIQVVLASGRLPHSIASFARQLGLGGVHIGLNGGVTFQTHGPILHKHLLSLEQLTEAHRYLESQGRFPMVFGTGGLWATQASPDLEFLHQSGEPLPRWYDPQHLEVIEDPAKVIVVLPPGPHDRLMAEEVEPLVHVVRSGPLFLEFMPPRVTKGAALTEYMVDQGFAAEEVLAIGDSENDASLLAAAGFSVAMGNAVDALKDQAHVITETNANDGVARALARFVLSNRGQ